MGERQANYPRNCWWMAARSEEIGRQPLGRWLLGDPVVLYRRESGGIVALEDRCPHRWAPLSRGRVAGDELVCGYHGFRYGADGRCTRIPSQSAVPAGMRVRSYPVEERGPIVWIWMGDPARRDEVQVPELPFATDPGWTRIGDYIDLQANYFLLQENVLDLTHFAFVHATTLEFEGWDAGEDEVQIDERGVRFRRTTRNLPLPPFLTIPAGLPDGAVGDSTTFGTILLPGVHAAGIDLGDPYRGANGGVDYQFRITHLTTPAAPDRTHYWWLVGQNYGTPQGNAAAHRIIVEAFDQDRVILESIQEVVTRDPRGAAAPEVSVTADRSGVQARRIRDAMLARDG